MIGLPTFDNLPYTGEDVLTILHKATFDDPTVVVVLE